MSTRPIRRLLLVPLTIAVLIGALIQVLSVSAPGVSAPDLGVADLPPPALPERACRRGDDGRAVAQIRRDHPPGGRVTAPQVLACPEAYDGLRVTFIGELIGDVLPRRGGAWVLVNDDTYALERGPLPAHRVSGGGTNHGLSVWLPAPLASRVADPELLGRPGRRGTVVSLTGVVVRADPRDAGRPTLQALTLTELAPSVALGEPVHRAQAVVAVVLAVLALGLTFLRRRASR